MNLWDALFTTQATEPPQFSLFWYLLLLMLVGLIYYASYRYRDKVIYRRLFQGVQALQLLTLYSWYALNHQPLSESLPFYHCRIAMFAVLFLPSPSKLKQYFALLGTFGATVAFIYPIYDPYPFPHVTILSFIIGHLALLGNALIYLFRYYDSVSLSWRQISVVTILMNAVIFVVNALTDGEYGFLRQPPFVGDHGILLNYIIVTVVLSTAVLLLTKVFAMISQDKVEASLRI